MRVLVDTTIWSLALRRRKRDLNPAERALVTEWSKLVTHGWVILIGPVRQEILSGVRRESDFAAIRRRLSAFRYLPVLAEDYDRAAEFFNRCRSSGIIGTATDFLICAVAVRARAAIFTTDRDFTAYSNVLPIRIHEVASDEAA